MDPTETLKQLRLVAGRMLAADDVDPEDARTLAELWEALDGWMIKGGFSPWDRGPFAVPAPALKPVSLDVTICTVADCDCLMYPARLVREVPA